MSDPELKRALQKKLGIIDRDLSDAEFENVTAEILETPKEKRTEGRLQQIVKKHTDIEDFYLVESKDMSDINYVMDKIDDFLKTKGGERGIDKGV